MKPHQVIRYCRELGWSDPPDLADIASRTGSTEQPPARQHAAQSLPPAAEAGAVAGERPGSLAELAACFADCDRCRLAHTRKHLVFGEGNEHASLLLVGEAPGFDEDRTGRPFVGQAGQLLDAMIFALGLERRQVFIANVLKCRPPDNRDPEPDEVAACSELLEHQIDLIKPTVIVALGKPATIRLTGISKPISALRGRWAAYRGIPVMPTFHPAYLLRNPRDKRQVWGDLKMIRDKLAS